MSTTCSQPLYITIFAFILAWLASVVIMPVVFWSLRFDLVQMETPV